MIIAALSTSFASCKKNNPINDLGNHTNNTNELKIVTESGKNNQNDLAMKTIFQSVLEGKTKVVMDGVFQRLSECSGYSGLLCDQPLNEYTFVDFDHDGVLEMILRSSLNGDYILHYDNTDQVVYVTFFSPRSGYTFFENGEFGYTSERYQIVKFNKGSVETATLTYDEKEDTPRLSFHNIIEWKNSGDQNGK